MLSGTDVPNDKGGVPMAHKITRKDIHTLVDYVTEDYMDSLYWTVQQFAAKGMNDAALDNKFHKK
jgi:hypothetical protein